VVDVLLLLGYLGLLLWFGIGTVVVMGLSLSPRGKFEVVGREGGQKIFQGFLEHLEEGEKPGRDILMLH
jgi:hypothetical protein